MSTITKDEFIEGLKKSRVIADAELQTWLESSALEDPTELAVELVKDGKLTKWQAKYLLSGRWVLDLGSYRLLERIKRDDMGDCFLAVHNSLGRKVNILLLPASLNDDESRCQAVIQKASKVATLDHPNLIHVFDIDQEGGRYFLVSEHTGGQPLTEYPKSDLDLTFISRVVSESLKGLIFAHLNDVLHGKLEPADIILSSRGEVKIGHMAHSPLRLAEGIESESLTAQDDFQTLSQIGLTLLKNCSNCDQDERQRLARLVKQVGTESADRSQLALEIEEFANESLDDELLGIAQPPIADLPELEQPVLQRKPQRVKPEPEEAAPEAEPSNSILTLWRDNPVAVIATSIVLLLLMIGTIGYFYRDQIFPSNGRDAQVANKDLSSNDSNPKPSVKAKDETESESEAAQQLPDLSAIENQIASLEPADAGGVNITKTEPKKTTPESERPSQPTDDSESEKSDSEKPDEPSTAPLFAGGDQSQNQTPTEGQPAKATRELLREITFIGEATQNAFYDADITTFKQLGETPISRIKEILVARSIPLRSNEVYKDWISESRSKAGLPAMTPEQWVASIGSGETKSSNTATKSTTSKEPETPFTKFPREFDLPDVSSTELTELAKLQIPPAYFLKLELTQNEGIAKSKMLFKLIRGDQVSGNKSREEKQRWLVGTGRNESKLTHIGVFSLVNGAFHFQWLEEALKNRNAQYLRNCFLKFSLPDESQAFAVLRKPMKVPDLRLTRDELSRRCEFQIPAIPNLDTVSIQIFRLEVKGSDNRVHQALVGRGKPGIIWLKRHDKTGFLRIQVASDIRKDKILLQSNLVLGNESAGVPQSPVKSIESLVALKNQLAYQRNFHNSSLNGYSGNNNTERETLEKNKNEADRNHALMIEYETILANLLDQPLKYEVTAKLGEIELVLAKADPSVPLSTGKRR